MNEQTPLETAKVAAPSPYLIPGAIVIAGVFIALAVVATGGGAPASQEKDVLIELPQAEILPIADTDHVRSIDGANPKSADVFLVEYSDYKCGYCGRFHATIVDVLEAYKGRVAWVYRHTPYQPGGKEAAVASECVAELAGEDAFWKYTDLALNNQSKITTEWHTATAVELGADEAAFKECVASGKYDELIATQTTNAQDMGGRGTPHNVLLTKEGRILPFPGAQPKEEVVKFVDLALSTLK